MKNIILIQIFQLIWLQPHAIFIELGFYLDTVLRQLHQLIQHFMTAYQYQDHLESDRLLTRFLTTGDILAWTAFFNDPEAVELFPDFGLDSNEEKAAYWINKQLARYNKNTFGLQAIINKKNNEFIGQSGLIQQEVDGETEMEVGYHIFKKHWGQGYAPEAAKLFINYAFKNNLTNSVISIIDIRNIKSQIVANKNGLTREKQTRWSNQEVFIYRIEKQNWPSK